MFVLRVLSELSLALLVQDGDVPDEDVRTEERKERGEEGGRAPEERDEGISSSKILALITESLLPRLVRFKYRLDSVYGDFYFCRMAIEWHQCSIETLSVILCCFRKYSEPLT